LLGTCTGQQHSKQFFYINKLAVGVNMTNILLGNTGRIISLLKRYPVSDYTVLCG